MIDLSFLDRVSILVIGDVMLDRYLWGKARRISPEAPVPVVEIDRETHTAGGAANVAMNLSALKVKCELIGITGCDDSGAEVQSLIRRAGIAFDDRFARPENSTITKTRIVAQRQQLCRLDKEAAPCTYSLSNPADLAWIKTAAQRHDAVIVSDYAKGTIEQPVIDALREVRKSRRDRPLFLAVDPKPRRPLDLSGMDLLTPNRAEAQQLAGVNGDSPTSLDQLAHQIGERHSPRTLVITLGDEGMLLRSSSGATRIVPTAAREVADVSGAGDTVVAALTAALAAGLDAESAVSLANVAAGIVVAKLGTATATREEILAVATPTGNHQQAL